MLRLLHLLTAIIILFSLPIHAVDVARSHSAPAPSRPPPPSALDLYRPPSTPTAPFRLARTLSVPVPLPHAHPRFQRLAGRLGAARYVRTERPAARHALAGALARRPEVLPPLLDFYRRDALRRQTAARVLLAAHARDVERPLLAQLDALPAGARADARRALVARSAAGARARDLGTRLQTALARLERDTNALFHLSGARERQALGAPFRQATLAMREGVHAVLGLMRAREAGARDAEVEDVVRLMRRRARGGGTPPRPRRHGRPTPRLYDPPRALVEEGAGGHSARSASGDEVYHDARSGGSRRK